MPVLSEPRRDKGGRRLYSDRERGEALAALEANRGNVKATAEALGIPGQTLRQWHQGERHALDKMRGLDTDREVREAAERDPALRDALKSKLADGFEALAAKAIGVAHDKVEDASAYQAALIAAIATDKALLLRGEATTIVSTADAERLAAFRARYSTVRPATVLASIQEGAPPPNSAERSSHPGAPSPTET